MFFQKAKWTEQDKRGHARKSEKRLPVVVLLRCGPTSALPCLHHAPYTNEPPDQDSNEDNAGYDVDRVVHCFRFDVQIYRFIDMLCNRHLRSSVDSTHSSPQHQVAQVLELEVHSTQHLVRI